MPNDDFLVMDGIPTSCIVGTCWVWSPDGHCLTLVYSGARILDYFIAQGMDADEAHEYISFNIEGAYVGGTTPIVLWDLSPADVEDILHET